MKKILGTYSAPRPHWVGNGFPVRSLFSYDTLGKHATPFLLLDYAGPAQFTPTDRPRGVGQHPHRGFETVTIVYQGEVAHRDSTGQGGVIGPGDVQWMTAGAGILHEEFHSESFARQGGELRDGATVGQSACQRQDGRAGLPGHRRRADPVVRSCQRMQDRCASSPATTPASKGRRAPSRRWTCGTCGCARARMWHCR